MSLTLRQICLVAKKIQPVIDDLKDILGIEVCYVDPGVEIFGLENALLPVGTNFIEIVSPIQEKTTAGRYLKRRDGDGGYMTIFQADSGEAHTAIRERAEKMDIRIAWEMEHEAVHYLQLHPADTGGSFFQIDWDTLNEHDGNWVSAGGIGWKEFINTDGVTAIKAAEIQSPDPILLARRWSSITDIPLSENAGENPEIQLENAVLRFVKETYGRGEGLGAIDIEAKDRERIVEKAKKRGLKASDSQVVICGLRFNLV